MLLIRWFFFSPFFTATAQNTVYRTYVKLKCTKVVNIFTDGLPCIPNATHSGSVAGDRARGLGCSCHCIAGTDWQSLKIHMDLSEHALLAEDVPKPWAAPGDTFLHSSEESPWALDASQSSVRSCSHAPPVFKKSSWRLQLMKKGFNLQCKTLQLES